MNITAILVDGGFYHKRANALWGKASARDRASDLHSYCLEHLSYKGRESSLYRIFYYDCPPLESSVFHPLIQKNIKMKGTDFQRWMTDFHKEMSQKRKVAMRMGRLSTSTPQYTLPYNIIKKLCNGSLKMEDLEASDFTLNVVQKGVDMRMGIDIISMTLKHQVSQIILISGDSDFVPAAKVARREGIDFILNPMWSSISSDLQEHIDGIRTPKHYPKEESQNG